MSRTAEIAAISQITARALRRELNGSFTAMTLGEARAALDFLNRAPIVDAAAAAAPAVPAAVPTLSLRERVIAMGSGREILVERSVEPLIARVDAIVNLFGPPAAEQLVREGDNLKFSLEKIRALDALIFRLTVHDDANPFTNGTVLPDNVAYVEAALRLIEEATTEVNAALIPVRESLQTLVQEKTDEATASLTAAQAAAVAAAPQLAELNTLAQQLSTAFDTAVNPAVTQLNARNAAMRILVAGVAFVPSPEASAALVAADTGLQGVLTPLQDAVQRVRAGKDAAVQRNVSIRSRLTASGNSPSIAIDLINRANSGTVVTRTDYTGQIGIARDVVAENAALAAELMATRAAVTAAETQITDAAPVIRAALAAKAKALDLIEAERIIAEISSTQRAIDTSVNQQDHAYAGIMESEDAALPEVANVRAFDRAVDEVEDARAELINNQLPALATLSERAASLLTTLKGAFAPPPAAAALVAAAAAPAPVDTAAILTQLRGIQTQVQATKGRLEDDRGQPAQYTASVTKLQTEINRLAKPIHARQDKVMKKTAREAEIELEQSIKQRQGATNKIIEAYVNQQYRDSYLNPDDKKTDAWSKLSRNLFWGWDLMWNPSAREQWAKKESGAWKTAGEWVLVVVTAVVGGILAIPFAIVRRAVRWSAANLRRAIADKDSRRIAFWVLGVLLGVAITIISAGLAGGMFAAVAAIPGVNVVALGLVAAFVVVPVLAAAGVWFVNATARFFGYNNFVLTEAQKQALVAKGLSPGKIKAAGQNLQDMAAALDAKFGTTHTEAAGIIKQVKDELLAGNIDPYLNLMSYMTVNGTNDKFDADDLKTAIEQDIPEDDDDPVFKQKVKFAAAARLSTRSPAAASASASVRTPLLPRSAVSGVPGGSSTVTPARRRHGAAASAVAGSARAGAASSLPSIAASPAGGGASALAASVAPIALFGSGPAAAGAAGPLASTTAAPPAAAVTATTAAAAGGSPVSAAASAPEWTAARAAAFKPEFQAAAAELFKSFQK